MWLEFASSNNVTSSALAKCMDPMGLRVTPDMQRKRRIFWNHLQLPSRVCCSSRIHFLLFKSFHSLPSFQHCLAQLSTAYHQHCLKFQQHKSELQDQIQYCLDKGFLRTIELKSISVTVTSRNDADKIFQAFQRLVLT